MLENMGILKFAWYGTFKKRPARCNQAAFQMNRELKHVWECFYDLVDHAHSSAIICTEMMWKPPLFDHVIGFCFLRMYLRCRNRFTCYFGGRRAVNQNAMQQTTDNSIVASPSFWGSHCVRSETANVFYERAQTPAIILTMSPMTVFFNNL